MTQAVQRYQPSQGLVATNVAELEQLGRMAAASGFFQDAREAAQAMVKIAAGQELGLPPIMSMTSINVIKGRVALSANLMAALLKRAGYRIKVTWTDNTVCTVTVWDQQGNECGDSMFSLDDAKQAGLGGDNWKKFPRNMLYARAVSNAARWYAPEVLTGCYLPDELDDAPIDQSRPVVVPQPVRVDSKVEIERVIDATEPVTLDLDGDRAMKRLHAVGRDHGLTHDEIRTITGASSLTELSAEQLDGWADAIRDLSETDVDAINVMKKAATPQELQAAWSSLSKHGKTTLVNAKDAAKARLGRYVQSVDPEADES